MNDVNKKIHEVVEEIVYKSVEDDDALYTSNLLDSMGTIDLATMLEDEFDIKIDIRDIIEENFDSVSKLETYIKKRLSE